MKFSPEFKGIVAALAVPGIITVTWIVTDLLKEHAWIIPTFLLVFGSFVIGMTVYCDQSRKQTRRRR